MAHPRRDELVKAIAGHLAEHGSNNWDELRSRFSDVPEATFWRCVRTAKATPANQAEIDQAYDRVRHIPGAAVDPTADRLPLPLIPLSFLTKAGPEAVHKLDLIQSINDASDDIELLRQFAKTKDGLAVQDAKVLADSIRLRMTLADLFISVMREVWSKEREAEFFQAVLETVRSVSPDCARSIVDRLKQLNSRLV